MITDIKSLSDISSDEKIKGFEQIYEFKIGSQGYTYEAFIERDNEGNIVDCEESEALNNPKIDSETWIAHYFNNDAYAWADLDQLMWDADKGETFIFPWNAQDVCGNSYEFTDEDMKFIEEHMDKEGYVQVYITVIENTIVERD